MSASWDDVKYLAGYGNHHASEALEGALPVGQNSPQVCPYGLYAEQIQGTAFTAPRASNLRTWMYRIRPSVSHDKFQAAPELNPHVKNTFGAGSGDYISPEQVRWMPTEIPSEPTTFVEGLRTLAGAGDAQTKAGLAIHMYVCNKSMEKTAFCSADGDMLIVPQQGTLRIRTELGLLEVPNGFIAVLPRGIRFMVEVDGPSRGYISEAHESNYVIPDLGPIGANGLANPRDFQAPTADYTNAPKEKWTIVQKYMGKLFTCVNDGTPFDVVAWHGNYAPHRYNLDQFNCMNSVTFDHPDPSIYTVLTAPSASPGVAVCDFVIFPPRWMVAEHTFRPPYFHKNTAAELMGLIRGEYEAKQGGEGGFQPGGASLHSCMTAHGPDAATFQKASTADLKPVKVAQKDLAFMFESKYMFSVTPFGRDAKKNENYVDVWKGLESNFTPNKK